MYGGNWFEEDIRVFISAERYENLIKDIFQSEDIFFKTTLLHWYNSECSFPSQRMKCRWSWSLIVVVVRIWRINIVGNAHWIRVTKKVLHFFHNKWHEKCLNFKVYIWFFYRKRFLTSIDRKGSYISDVWWISFYARFKLKIFIFCIRVKKFYTFSWNGSYIYIYVYIYNIQVSQNHHQASRKMLCIILFLKKFRTCFFLLSC